MANMKNDYRALEKYATDLNQLARKLEQCISTVQAQTKTLHQKHDDAVFNRIAELIKARETDMKSFQEDMLFYAKKLNQLAEISKEYIGKSKNFN